MKKKILCLFDYKATTGFATVSQNIIPRIKRHFGDSIELHICSINYFGDPIYEEDGTVIFSAVKSAPKKDDFGRFGFLKILKDSNEYDGIFIIQDLGVIIPIIEILDFIKSEKRKNNQKSFKSIFYFPVDCSLIRKQVEGLEFFDTLITYTEFGRNEVLKLRPELKGKLKVIPHGTDTKNFYPIELDEIHTFRKKYFGQNADKFIIMNLNRNQPRKDIPNTIFAFIEAKKSWKYDRQPFLYLHCNPDDPMGHNLRAVFLQTDLIEGEDYLFPSKEEENHGSSLDKLNKIYNSVDLLVTTTLGEGWGLCLSSKSKVLTINGTKEIKDINIGDKVLTNSGKFELVLDTTTRKVQSYIEVKTKYGYLVEATHEHPYYSLVNGKEEYRNISQLKKGDYLAIVKQNPVENISITNKGFAENSIDLLKYLPKVGNWKFDEKYIYNKWGYSPKSKKWSIANICKEYLTTKKVVENAIAYITGGKQKVSETSYRLANNLIADGFDKPKPLKINRYVALNNDVLWMFGWYLAEGSCEGGKRIEFSMGRDEVEYANRIAQIIKENFGIKDVIVRVYQNKCAVRVSSVALALVFKEIFGNGAFNKRVPEFLFKHPKSLMPLVDGYIKGDGHINLDGDIINFSTVSHSLAYQIQSILVSNGIMLSINKNNNNKNVFYTCTIPLTHLRKYIDKVGILGKLYREGKRNHKPDFIETNTHFFVPIISIKEIKKEDEFYDLCVENSHSFVANGLVCHNTFTESAATMLPIICPNHTSFTEMSNNGERAFVLDEFTPYVNSIDNILRLQTNYQDVAESILYLADSILGESKDDIHAKELLDIRTDKAYEWAKKLNWDNVCKQWNEYFKETYKL